MSERSTLLEQTEQRLRALFRNPTLDGANAAPCSSSAIRNG